MRKLLDSISIKNLNTIQRGGYFATIVGCLILIFLHNPMSSYDIYETKSYGDGTNGFRRDIYTSRITGRTFMYEGNARTSEYFGDNDRFSNAGWECSNAAELFRSVDEEPDGSPERERVEKKARATLDRLDCYGDWFKPFSEWTTISPLVAWLGNIVNLIFSIFSVLGLGYFWLFVFRTTDPRRG